MRFGFCSGFYTSRSRSVADEECINLYPETVESQASQVASKAYGGASAQPLRSLYWTPGLKVFATLPDSPVRGGCSTPGRCFFVGGANLVELLSDGSQLMRGAVANDGQAVSIAISQVQLLIVAAGRAYCFTLATNTLTDVTASLAGIPAQVEFSDGYFIVWFQNSNKFQLSMLLDGTSWPGLQVNEVSVFAENINSILVNHRELWVFGSKHAQPYTNTGSAEIFDVIPGQLIETGCAATFSTCRLDNTVFWIGQDERGARIAWRAQGYNPQRISTHAIEAAWGDYSATNFANLVSYAYQDGGHLFWVLYIPGADCSWVYDVAEGLWHKRAFWLGAAYEPHHSWNHVYFAGMHLVGDWKSGNVYQMDQSLLDDAGTMIRRLRRAPTVSNEMEWVFWSKLTIDFETGLGPQPPLLDGAGNPRPPQAMFRWSDDRGFTWSNEHWRDCGFAGQYKTRAVWYRLGRSRYRVPELVVTDPIPWVIIDAYLGTPDAQ